MNTIKDQAHLEQLLKEEKAFYIYKHSTSCPISFRAKTNVDTFIKQNVDYGKKVFTVLVIEQRPLSQYIAQLLSVEHQSPQALLIKDGKCVWNASHSAVNEDELKKNFDKIS